MPQYYFHTICEKRKELDVLGVGAYDGKQLIGFAACSADCDTMWQIGVDVLPQYRRKGIASTLTSVLASEIIDRGKIPFYCCAWSNIKSARNAYENPMTRQQVAKLMDFELRQADYYYNAGKYLGLFEKISEDKQPVIALTSLGNHVFKLNYKNRQLKLTALLNHPYYHRYEQGYLLLLSTDHLKLCWYPPKSNFSIELIQSKNSLLIC